MKVKLTALCPMHIGGSDQRIRPSELVVFDGRCFVIHNERLFSSLLERGLLEALMQAIGATSHEVDMRQFLNEHGLLNRAFLDEHAAHSSACQAERVRELRGFVRNAYGQPYVPGSTVKGVIRTSVLYSLLDALNAEQRGQVLDEFARKRLGDYARDPRSRMRRPWFREQFKQWFAQELDRRFFQRYPIGKAGKRFSPHTDVMRAIRVSDSKPLDKDSLAVEEIKIHSARSDHSPKPWSIYAECAQKGTEFWFDLSVDKALVAEFAESAGQTPFGVSFENIQAALSNPLEAVAHATQALYRHEQEFYHRESLPTDALDFDGAEPNFRIGWGIGLLGTSVSLLLPEGILRDIRNSLFIDREETPAPKSRKTVLTPGGPTSLGWCVAQQVNQEAPEETGCGFGSPHDGDEGSRELPR